MIVHGSPDNYIGLYHPYRTFCGKTMNGKGNFTFNSCGTNCKNCRRTKAFKDRRKRFIAAKVWDFGLEAKVLEERNK